MNNFCNRKFREMVRKIWHNLNFLHIWIYLVVILSLHFLRSPANFRENCISIFSLFFARMCLKRKSEKTKIARPKINNQKCPPCGRTSNYRKSWAPRPQQLETPRLTLGKIRRETSLEPESVPQKYHCYQLWYSLLPGADTCLVSAPAQNCVTHVESSLPAS